MSQLSIFVDESGGFGPYEHHAPYYLLTFVFHDQQDNLCEKIKHLQSTLIGTEYSPTRAIHTGPLIRREDEYKMQSIDERRRQLYKLLSFALHSPYSYHTLLFEQKQFVGELELGGRMAREISSFFHENLEYFQSFDQIILYYDNGQVQISRMLNIVLNALFFNVEFRTAMPADYFLLQVADLICTVELLAIKHKRNSLTKSEKLFFYKPQEIKKNFLRPLRKKRFVG
jgi:hypothetical protein